MTNSQEWRAATNSTDALPVLKMPSFSKSQPSTLQRRERFATDDARTASPPFPVDAMARRKILSRVTTNNQEPKLPFQDCTAEQVFAEITASLAAPGQRALWTRLQDEIKRQGTSASATYLGGEFTRLKHEFIQALANNG
jgi:hypothetical protein